MPPFETTTSVCCDKQNALQVDREVSREDLDNMANALSRTSRMVLDLLREDSRRTTTEIAHELGVSRTTVAYHIAKLTRDGTIRRFTIDADPAASALPDGVRAMFDVVLSRGSCHNVYPAIAHWKELVSCWSTSGSVDMRILVEAVSHRRIDELRERLGRHPNVGNLTTSFILRTFKENHSVWSTRETAEDDPTPDRRSALGILLRR
jgi:Lrp/AsnC family leucine-responsive transcriptional regulator